MQSPWSSEHLQTLWEQSSFSFWRRSCLQIKWRGLGVGHIELARGNIWLLGQGLDTSVLKGCLRFQLICFLVCVSVCVCSEFFVGNLKGFFLKKK